MSTLAEEELDAAPRAFHELCADVDALASQRRDRVPVHRRLRDGRAPGPSPEPFVVARVRGIVDVWDEAPVVLCLEHMGKFGHGAIGLTELRPDERVEAGVPQPPERVRHRVRNRVARRLPMRLHDFSHAVDQYRHWPMPLCALVSFRLGMSDGVSVVAAGWQRALGELGFEVRTIAGEGPVDTLLPGLAIRAPHPADDDELRAVLADVDLVVVENLCTIPLNLPAARAMGRVLTGRPAIMHHHDPPWQLPQHAHVTELPLDDPAWRHVVINNFTRAEFACRGIEATRIYNGFDPYPPRGARDATRRALDVGEDERLLVHPVRAIPRKNVSGALELAAALDATYWLTGPAEDGYAGELRALLDRAQCRVIRRPSPGTAHDAYAAADAVAFPSLREGFGNPPIEAALHRRPAAVGRYPAAEELRSFGFRWFDPDRPQPLDAFLRAPDASVLDHNRRVAIRHFSYARMAADIEQLLDEAGCLP